MNGLKTIENRNRNYKPQIFAVYCPKGSDWKTAEANVDIKQDLQTLNLTANGVKDYQGFIIGAIKLTNYNIS